MTLEEIKEDLRIKNPTLHSGSDQSGYEQLNEEDYEAVIHQWALGVIAKQEKEAEKAKAVADKSALLERLGITDDEAKLLLG